MTSRMLSRECSGPHDRRFSLLFKPRDASAGITNHAPLSCAKSPDSPTTQASRGSAERRTKVVQPTNNPASHPKRGAGTHHQSRFLIPLRTRPSWRVRGGFTYIRSFGSREARKQRAAGAGGLRICARWQFISFYFPHLA